MESRKTGAPYRATSAKGAVLRRLLSKSICPSSFSIRVRTCLRSDRNSSSSWRIASRSAMADANCDSSADFSERKLVTSSTARVMRSSR
jgi:hypothetical protein